METKDISELAKTHTDAIFAHQMTKAEVVMLLAVISARVNQALAGTVPPTAPVKADIATKPLGAKIAEKGYPCVCVMCSKHIYTLNRDLYENTTVKDFIEAYTPMPGYKPLNRQSKISNVENNITMNCPDCGAELGLYLAGRHIG